MNAATTPSDSRALDTSTLLIFAWANGLRTMDAHTIPGRVRSSMKRDWPVSSAPSSLRATGFPM